MIGVQVGLHEMCRGSNQPYHNMAMYTSHHIPIDKHLLMFYLLTRRVFGDMYVFVYNYCYFLFLGSGVEGNIGKHASATAMMRTDVQRPTPRRSCWVGLSGDCEGSEKSRPEWHFVRGSSYASQEQCSGFMCQQVRKLLWEAGLIVLVLAGRFEIQTSLA